MIFDTDGKLHPRFGGIALDAMVLDRNGGPRDALVDRLLALNDSNAIHFLEPGTAYRQTQHPNTPAGVRQTMGAQIFSIATGLNPVEQARARRVCEVMRGNSTTDRHDEDAAILFEAGKHGCGYLITEDKRIIGRRGDLQKILGPPLCIVTLEEFLTLYDLFIDEEREREKILAPLR